MLKEICGVLHALVCSQVNSMSLKRKQAHPTPESHAPYVKTKEEKERQADTMQVRVLCLGFKFLLLVSVDACGGGLGGGGSSESGSDTYKQQFMSILCGNNAKGNLIGKCADLYTELFHEERCRADTPLPSLPHRGRSISCLFSSSLSTTYHFPCVSHALSSVDSIFQTFEEEERIALRRDGHGRGYGNGAENEKINLNGGEKRGNRRLVDCSDDETAELIHFTLLIHRVVLLNALGEGVYTLEDVEEIVGKKQKSFIHFILFSSTSSSSSALFSSMSSPPFSSSRLDPEKTLTLCACVELESERDTLREIQIDSKEKRQERAINVTLRNNRNASHIHPHPSLLFMDPCFPPYAAFCRFILVQPGPAPAVLPACPFPLPALCLFSSPLPYPSSSSPSFPFSSFPQLPWELQEDGNTSYDVKNGLVGMKRDIIMKIVNLVKQKEKIRAVCLYLCVDVRMLKRDWYLFIYSGLFSCVLLLRRRTAR